MLLRKTPIQILESASAVSMPNAEEIELEENRVNHELVVTLRNHFFRPQNAVAPEEAALQAHNDSTIFLREISRFVTDHFVQR